MTAPAPTRRLSTRDEAKPFILIGAIVTGFVINRLADGALTDYGWLVQVGLFAVVFSIMAFVEVKGVGRAFRKTKPTALAITTNFVLVPLFAWALGWLILQDHPDLWAGIILYTLTPCIGWYLIFIDLARGNLDWGLAMLPIDITLQILLLPLYLWLLIGKVIPIEPLVLIRSVALFLLLPFAAAYAVRTLLTRWRGHDFTYGPYKHAISEVRLWALVIVVTAIFATQHALEGTDITNVALIIATITLFFVGLFTIALAVGRVFPARLPRHGRHGLRSQCTQLRVRHRHRRRRLRRSPPRHRRHPHRPRRRAPGPHRPHQDHAPHPGPLDLARHTQRAPDISPTDRRDRSPDPRVEARSSVSVQAPGI